jgi:hypothetical protein
MPHVHHPASLAIALAIIAAGGCRGNHELQQTAAAPADQGIPMADSTGLAHSTRAPTGTTRGDPPPTATDPLVPRPSAAADAPVDSSVECTDPSAIDVLQHTVELVLRETPQSLGGSDPALSGNPSIIGRGNVRVRARQSTRRVVLDAHELRFTHVSALAQRAPLQFKHQGRFVCVELPQPLAAGATLELSMAWEVLGGKMPRIGSDQIWSGYDAAAWMPTRQDSAQRATLQLRVRAPREWKVVGPGRRIDDAAISLLEPASEISPDALRPKRTASTDLASHAFEVVQPSPPFLFAFAAGRFDEAETKVDRVRLRALGPPGANLGAALAITAPMVRFLMRRTGTAPPNNAYTQVFVEGDAAQEAAGFALLAATALDDVKTDPQDDWIFLHELAHQWFGWQVACTDFNDFWLNEGFATFLVGAYKEERWGPAAYAQEVELWRRRSAKVHAEARDAPLSRSLPGQAPALVPQDSDLPARGVTYSRGALVLLKLREELGDDAFWAGIRRYVQSRAWKGARSEDLRAALEATSGRDLRAFFERWVYAPAYDL